MKTIRLDEIGSTNEYAKSLVSGGEDVVVVARRQTGGRGTKGRIFSSNEGGVYLTKLRFYENFPSKNAFLIMARAAVSVCKTLESFGFAPVIKWANDVFVNDKKICGILIENAFSGGAIAHSVVGIGLNVNNALPEELSEIATTMQKEKNGAFDVEKVLKKLLFVLEEEHDIEEYIQRVGYLHRQVTLIEGERSRTVVLRGVTKTGELVVEDEEKVRAVCAGEVSLKIERRAGQVRD